MDWRRLTLVAVLALALAACGSEDQTAADKAFGDMTERDEALADDVTAEIRRFSERYTDFVVAVNEPDPQNARAAVDGMDEHLDRAAGKVGDAENTDWRATYEQYLGTMERVTTVAERIVEYLEAPGAPRPRFEDRLAAQLDAAVKDAQKADRELLDRVAEHASPEERERLEQQYRDAQRRFERETGQ